MNFLNTLLSVVSPLGMISLLFSFVWLGIPTIHQAFGKDDELAKGRSWVEMLFWRYMVCVFGCSPLFFAVAIGFWIANHMKR